MNDDLVKRNLLGDVFLTDERNVYFIPKNWCYEFSVSAGFTGGLDYIDDEGNPKPEIYCYAPLYVKPNSEVDTLFVSVDELQKMREVSEQSAYIIHPKLKSFLESIDNATK